MSEFEIWWVKAGMMEEMGPEYAAEHAWDYQQAKIDQLEARLKVLQEGNLEAISNGNAGSWIDTPEMQEALWGKEES